MPSLKEYKRKRDFKKTPEPAARERSNPEGRRYVIQKHDASHLHYDLRLEHAGVLLSWAIPKGPSLVPGDKRLAVHVEDHPLDYGSFEGTIPDDQYGGGTVLLWDRGEWEPVKDAAEGLERGQLEFNLHGEKLHGAWVLTRMRKKNDDGKEHWLLIKRRDESARSPDDPDILEAEPLSVATGRSLPEIAAANEDEIWESGKPSGKAARKRRSRKKERAQSTGRADKPAAQSRRAELDPAQLPGARKSSFPDSLRPQLATLVKDAPEGDDWLHEIKFDGYRLLCMIHQGNVRLITRNGNDWTRKFPHLAEAAGSLNVDQAVLDGELVAITSKGISDFQTLQNALAGGPQELVFYAFDLPYCEGFDLRRTPLLERKRLLHDLLVGAGSEGTIRYSDHIRGSGPAVRENACRMGMEGIICKRADSVYESKRSRYWLKVKCIKRQEFVICGYTKPKGSRSGFGALLLSYYDDGRLTYCGRVGTGFNEKRLRDLHKQLSSLQVDKPPVVNPPKGAAARSTHWVRPQMVAEVEFTEWTDEGMLRHPSFVGIREDKSPRQVVRESVMPPATPEQLPGPSPPKRSRSSKRSSSPDDSSVAGVRLTNPERVLYPDQGITKLQLARFYESIADWILPQVVKRPLALVRCPRGRSEKCFFQKHVTESLPEGIKGVSIRESRDVQQTVMIQDLAGLIGLVQIGVLEIHLWGSRADNVEKPDRLVFDLDPGPDVDWEQVRQAAIRVREVLDELGLISFVKTSGGKGLHVLAPITRRHDWSKVKPVCAAIARRISRADPARYVANMAKSKRHGRVFIDYLRNGRGATSIAPYSTRARPGAPVSTPVAWDDLTSSLTPDAYRVDNLPQRLARLKKDPWSDFSTLRQSITARMIDELDL